MSDKLINKTCYTHVNKNNCPVFTIEGFCPIDCTEINHIDSLQEYSETGLSCNAKDMSLAKIWTDIIRKELKRKGDCKMIDTKDHTKDIEIMLSDGNDKKTPLKLVRVSILRCHDNDFVTGSINIRKYDRLSDYMNDPGRDYIPLVENEKCKGIFKHNIAQVEEIENDNR